MSTSRYQSFCKKVKRAGRIKRLGLAMFSENGPMRDELSNGGLHVVVPPQELCKGPSKGEARAEKPRGENGRTEVEEDFGGRF